MNVRIDHLLIESTFSNTVEIAELLESSINKLFINDEDDNKRCSRTSDTVSFVLHQKFYPEIIFHVRDMEPEGLYEMHIYLNSLSFFYGETDIPQEQIDEINKIKSFIVVLLGELSREDSDILHICYQADVVDPKTSKVKIESINTLVESRFRNLAMNCLYKCRWEEKEGMSFSEVKGALILSDL